MIRASSVALALILVACGAGAASDIDAPVTDASADSTSVEVAPDSIAVDGVDTDDAPSGDTIATDTRVSRGDTTDATSTETSPPDGLDATSEDVDTADAPAGPDLAGPCPLAVRRGGFQVVDDGEYGWVDGTVSDGVLPVSVLTLVTTEGDCRLYRKSNPFCDPPCDPGQACDYDGSCLPHPEPQDIGTVTLTGLAGPVAMTPIQPGNLYYATDIPYPPWTPGDVIALAATGGPAPDSVAPFALEGVAPEALAPTSSQWTLVSGQALEVAWAPPSEPEPSTRVELSLLIDQHGNSPASLRCDFVDDGQATVPSTLLDALRTAGVSGFPSGRLVRQTVDHVVLAGDACVDFAARSPRSIRVTVSGHVPCVKDQDCPLGKTCDESVETCVDD